MWYPFVELTHTHKIVIKIESTLIRLKLVKLYRLKWECCSFKFISSMIIFSTNANCPGPFTRKSPLKKPKHSARSNYHNLCVKYHYHQRIYGEFDRFFPFRSRSINGKLIYFRFICSIFVCFFCWLNYLVIVIVH